MSTIDIPGLTYSNIFPPTPLIRKLVDYTTHYAELCDQLHIIGSKAGTGSNGFKLRKQEIMAVQPNISKIIQVMKSSKYIRPLLALWNETPSLTLDFPVPFVRDLVAHIDKLALQSRRGRLGRLALFELCHLFFRFYDDLACIDEISACLKKHLGRYKANERIMGLNNVREHLLKIISVKGHEFLADIALLTGQNLPTVATHYTIPRRDSRFYEKALLMHYMTRLNQLKPNENAQILHEVLNSRDYDIQLDYSFRFGHKIITTLMDKLIAAGREPSMFWRNVILSIADDPRLPPSSDKYSKWWSSLELKYPQTMRGWLSKVDLELFLKIMAEYAKNQGDPALQRMYPERERFLRGLFKKKLIKETRLYLGSKVLRYINNLSSQGQRLAYVQIKDGGESAIFYVNLGSAHLIEGSYNCTMRIMDKIPQKSCLNGFPTSVSNTQLRTVLMDLYKYEFGKTGQYHEVRHTGWWQEKAVRHLNSMGVQILPSDVMDSQTFYGGN